MNKVIEKPRPEQLAIYLAGCLAVGAVTIEIAKAGVLGETTEKYAKMIGGFINLGQVIDMNGEVFG